MNLRQELEAEPGWEENFWVSSLAFVQPVVLPIPGIPAKDSTDYHGLGLPTSSRNQENAPEKTDLMEAMLQLRIPQTILSCVKLKAEDK